MKRSIPDLRLTTLNEHYAFYGSNLVPKIIFGEDTPELAAFYEANKTIAPGAWELLQDLLNSWQPYALKHYWVMPDGFDVQIKVMTLKETRINVDELNSSFTYQFSENVGTKKGKSNVANLTHSVDGYVCRTMHRRCNYDLVMITEAKSVIQYSLTMKTLTGECTDTKVRYYLQQYTRSGIADIVILPYLTKENVCFLTEQHLSKLLSIIEGMLQYKPFPLITVHDDFKSHPNNVNWVRWNYKEILADLAESHLLSDLFSQLYGEPCTYQKLEEKKLGDIIRKSNYALC